MLASNRAASIAMAINIHLWMQAIFYISVHKGFSINFSIRGSSSWWSRARMVRVTALDIQVNLREPTPCWRAAWLSVNALWSGFNRQANTAWCPRQVRCDRSNCQIVRLPVGHWNLSNELVVSMLQTYLTHTRVFEFLKPMDSFGTWRKWKFIYIFC